MSQCAVLVVDDEVPYCEIVGQILASYGLEIHTAHNAAEALSLLMKVTPNLILLDVMMPKVDGLALIHLLRTNPAWLEIPIVIASARAGSDERYAALAAGAVSFLAKPFSAGELRAALRPFLPMSESAELVAPGSSDLTPKG